MKSSFFAEADEQRASAVRGLWVRGRRGFVAFIATALFGSVLFAASAVAYPLAAQGQEGQQQGEQAQEQSGGEEQQGGSGGDSGSGDQGGSKVALGEAGNRRRKGDNRNRVVERGSKVALREIAARATRGDSKVAQGEKATKAMGMSSKVARLNLKSLRCQSRLQRSRLSQSSQRAGRAKLKSQRANLLRQSLQPKRLCLRSQRASLTNPLPRGNLRLLHLRRLLGLLWGRIGLWRLTLRITSPAAP